MLLMLISNTHCMCHRNAGRVGQAALIINAGAIHWFRHRHTSHVVAATGDSSCSSILAITASTATEY